MRIWPAEWTPDLFTGDMWAACTVTVDAAATWTDDRVSWTDAAVSWLGAGLTIHGSPVGGSLTRDWSGPSARTTATIDLPASTPDLDWLHRGQWVTIRGHITTPDAAPADGDPTDVPSCVIATLLITGILRDATLGLVTVTADDLVTVLGARQLDSGAGPTGYTPTARTAKTVIAELAARFGDPRITLIDRSAPDAPWSPDADGSPLTGTVWSAIETMATLAGLTIQADGAALILGPRTEAEDQTGLTITEIPGPGTVTPYAQPEDAPAPTRVIVTGQDTAGNDIAGRAEDVTARNAQRFAWDDLTSIDGATTSGQLTVAAAARLQWLRAQQSAGTLRAPWLPMLEPGDLVQVLWAARGPRTHYLQSVTVPLNPLEATELTVRGGNWITWQTWKDTHTWETLRADSWMNRLRKG